MTPGEVGRMLASLQRIEALLETLIGLETNGSDAAVDTAQVGPLPLRANPTPAWRRPSPPGNGVRGRN